MKSLSRRLVLPSLLLFTASSFASEGASNNPNNSTTDLTTYLLNLGQYLGYNLQTSPEGTSGGKDVTQNLMPVTSTAIETILLSVFQSVFGALPVNTAGQGSNLIVPSNIQAYASINAFANSTFTSSSYSSPSASQVSVSTLIDQPTYQTDPVSQAVLNMLTTPDSSYCLNNDGTAWATCTYPSGVINGSQVMQNVIGNDPPADTQTYFTYNYNHSVLSQLNGNSLIAPLMYTTTSSGGASTSSGIANTGNPGLTAQTQAQQAANFIRYAASVVTPVPLPNRQIYDALFVKSQNLDNSYTKLEQFQAQSTLANYLTTLRVYAAQTSVGISNLYYILSRRMPQPILSSDSQQSMTSSQALSEFTMATWRLYNPDTTQSTTDWLTKINQASSGTTQKEIAVLLAEINYQLYLTRQQQERLLLTNTILLLQNARQAQPTSTLGTTAN